MSVVVAAQPVTNKYINNDDIAVPLPDYDTYIENVKLVKALHGGTKAMRAAGREYLPQEEGESDKAYSARLIRAVLNNYYKRTLEKLKGQAFEEDIEISDDVPENVVLLFENIDQQNNNLDLFMGDVFYKAIHKGVAHIMVDYPNTGATTVEEQKKAGARPYWCYIDPDNVIGWRTKTENGVTKLTQLRVKEEVTIDSGIYGVKKEERIRLYEPGLWAVYSQGTSGWVIAKDEAGRELRGATSLDFIPLVTLMLGEKTSEMTAIPCLQDLAELNCTHWQSSSDQRNILHYARLITYFGKALDMDDATRKVKFAANSLVHARNKDADLKIVEHSGAGIEAGRNDLKDLELAMAIFGLSMLLPKVQGSTATENTLEKSESDSALVSWVKSMGSALETLLDYTCRWLNTEKKGSLKPYADFNMALKSADASILISAKQANIVPAELVLNEFKQRGIIMSDIDMQEIERMFEDQLKRATDMQAASGFNLAGQGAQGGNQFPPKKKQGQQGAAADKQDNAQK